MLDTIPQGATVGSLIPGPTGDKLTAAATKYGVDPMLVHSLAYQESGGSQAAHSPKGAIGVMQLLPHTAQQLGVDPTDEDENIDGGVRYLSQMLDRYQGDEGKALAAYNAGPQAVDTHGGVPPYKETQSYVKSIESRLPQPTGTTPQNGVMASPEAIPASQGSSLASTPSVSSQASGEALPEGTQVGEPIPADATAEPIPEGAQVGEPKQESLLSKAWNIASTPVLDQVAGPDSTRNAITYPWRKLVSGETGEQFAHNHPIWNQVADLAGGLTSPLSLALMGAGPAISAASDLPIVGPAISAGGQVLKRIPAAVIGYEGGKWAGGDIGDLVGQPAAGRTIGGLVGAGYGLTTGEPVPGVKSTLMKWFFPEAEAVGSAGLEKVAAAEAGTSTQAAQAATEAEPLSMRQIGSRIKQGVMDAAGTTDETPIYNRADNTVGAKTVSAEPNPGGPSLTQNLFTPSRNETLVSRVEPIAQQIPIKESPAAFSQPAGPAIDESVHPMDRQFIHVNGAQLFDATAGQPELREDLYQLRGKQLMEVLRKSGVDMSDIESVGESGGQAPRGGTIANPKNIGRNEAFDILLNEKGYTPEQILREAPTAEELGLKPVQRRKPFGPPR